MEKQNCLYSGVRWSLVDGARAKIAGAFARTPNENSLQLHVCMCPMPKYLHFSTVIARSVYIALITIRETTLCKYLVVFQWFIFGHVIYRQALDLQQNTGGFFFVIVTGDDAGWFLFIMASSHFS